MRIIETKVYTFEELSEDAKQKAIETLTEGGGHADYIFSDAGKTLEVFAEVFNINYRNIDFLEPYRNDYKINFTDEQKELSGVRLMSFIQNNFGSDLFKPEYIGNIHNPTKHKRIKIKDKSTFYAYYSGCQKTSDCTLTGVCYDHSVLAPIYQVLEGKELNTTLEELIDNCIKSLCKDVEAEYEHTFTEEYISEMCEVNNYEFTEDSKWA